jgi:palmitoyltransferase ZDHHC9/14/18
MKAMLAREEDEDDGDDVEARAARKKKREGEEAAAAAQQESVKSFPFRIRFCTTCNRYRAPRTFHCDVCHACVDAYDHHCSFTGTCIGGNNYASFLGFMFSLQLTIVFYFISVVAGPVELAMRADMCLESAMTMMGWMPVLIIIVIFLISFGPSALLVLHVYLASTGLTTMEHLREKYAESPNPFDRGFVRNWLRALGASDSACATERYDSLVIAHEREMLRYRQ